jgi:cytochrome b involved in lipid metabolism
MAIHFDRNDGETDMRRSRTQFGQKTVPHREEQSNVSVPKQKRRLRYFCANEIARHNAESSAWIVAGEEIYDVTEYMHQHPAGKEPILRRAGGAIDCTQDLMFHSKRGRIMWKEHCLIGKVTTDRSLNGQFILEKPWWAFWE